MAASHTVDLAVLRAVFATEHEAAACLREARARVADVVGRAVRSGTSYTTLACASFRARTGRPPSLRELLREARRLRQVTRRHRKALGQEAQVCASELRCVQEVAKMPTLIKRRIVEETYGEPDESTDLDDGTDLDDAGDDDHDDEAEPEPERRGAR